MLDNPIWASLLVAVLAGGVGSCLTWWFRDIEALRATKRDVLRRILAYRYRLAPDWRLRSGQEEPFIALNEAAVVFAKSKKVRAKWMDWKKEYIALNLVIDGDVADSTEKTIQELRVKREKKSDDAMNLLIEAMAKNCKLPTEFFEDDHWNPLMPSIHRVRRIEATLAAKRDILRRVMGHRHRIGTGTLPVRWGNEEPYVALNEAAIAFADCPPVIRRLEWVYDRIDGVESSDKPSSINATTALLKAMAIECDFPVLNLKDDKLISCPIIPEVHEVVGVESRLREIPTSNGTSEKKASDTKTKVERIH